MKFLAILTGLIVFLSSCSTAKKGMNDSVVSNNEKRVQVSEVKPWFNPNDLEENDIKIADRGEQDRIEVAKAIDPNVSIEDRIKKEAEQIVDGFRVQLQASKSSPKMESALKIAKDYFNPKGYEVYLVYEAPLYKLRVGDATTRKSAEKVLKLCKDSGYRDSWIVPDMVNGTLDQDED